MAHTKVETTPDRDEMSAGLRGLSELIEREVPVRVDLVASAPLAETGDDFGRVAHCLHDVEHGLDGLWPED